MNHWYFTEQVATDHRQALTEQADAHRLLNRRATSPKRRRGLALRLRLTRRRRPLLPTPASVPPTAPHPLPPT